MRLLIESAEIQSETLVKYRLRIGLYKLSQSSLVQEGNANLERLIAVLLAFKVPRKTLTFYHMKVNTEILVIQNSFFGVGCLLSLVRSEGSVHLIYQFVKDSVVNDDPVELFAVEVLDLVACHALLSQFSVKGIKESVVLKFLVDELFQFVFLVLRRLRALMHLIC